MQKQEIVKLLDKKHQQLFDWLAMQQLEKWELGPKEKWTTGEHIVHLIQSMKPLNYALRYPKFLLKWRFGVNNRTSRNYDDVCKRYKEKLIEAEGLVSPFSKNMQTPKVAEKQTIIEKLAKENEILKNRFLKWNDEKLDELLLPHPLMGKMTVREIVMWTAFHTQCHLETLEKKY